MSKVWLYFGIGQDGSFVIEDDCYAALRACAPAEHKAELDDFTDLITALHTGQLQLTKDGDQVSGEGGGGGKECLTSQDLGLRVEGTLEKVPLKQERVPSRQEGVPWRGCWGARRGTLERVPGEPTPSSMGSRRR
jgi:hypothetical protein